MTLWILGRSGASLQEFVAPLLQNDVQVRGILLSELPNAAGTLSRPVFPLVLPVSSSIRSGLLQREGCLHKTTRGKSRRLRVTGKKPVSYDELALPVTGEQRPQVGVADAMSIDAGDQIALLGRLRPSLSASCLFCRPSDRVAGPNKKRLCASGWRRFAGQSYRES